MKTLSLQNLTITDFMGIEDFTLEADGESLKISGDNATGKTTIKSAFTFLFFGEDSRKSSQFDIKPVMQPEAETAVTGKFKYKNEEFNVTRKYGDSREYAVNGVPKKKSEFTDFLEDKFDLDKLQILTDPRRFNEIHWQDRRERLMSLTKGVEVEDAVAVNSDLKDLDLQGLKPKDRRTQLKAEVKELEDEKGDIPVQIKTLQENAPEFEEEPDDISEFLTKLEAEKEGLVDLKENLEEDIEDLKSSGRQAELRKKKNELGAEMVEFERTWKKEAEDDIGKQEKERKEVKQDFNKSTQEIKEKEQEKEQAEERIQELDNRKEHLRDRWHEIKDQKFDGESCPTCRQEIPEDELEEIRKEINADRAQKIAEIQDQGDKAKEQQKELKGKVERLKVELEDLREEKSNLKEDLSQFNELIENLEDQKELYSEQDEYQELETKRAAVVEKLESEEKGPSEELEEKNEALDDVKQGIDEQSQAIAEAKNYRRTLSKVGKLKAKESKLAGKLETLKNQKRLVNEFVKTKAEILESSINQKFDLVDFKLFEAYKSKEGVKEVCQTTLDGVSWSTLNNAGRIKAGLDIIRTLGQEWDLQAPVFIDNSESIVEIPEGGSHQIELEVREGVDELEVE